MRIPGQSDPRPQEWSEQEQRLAPVERARDFSRLLDEKRKKNAQEPLPGFDDGQRQQRLKAFFQALLAGDHRWQDDSVSIRLAGHGRLQWQLLNGPLAGCSIFADWEGCQLRLEMTAAGSLADRLTRFIPQLERQLSRLNSRFFITVKVTRETGYL